jgi:LGFP repeat
MGDRLSAQWAWWQLGFRMRRSVVRHAKAGDRHPDPEVARIAACWAEGIVAGGQLRWAFMAVGATVTVIALSAARPLDSMTGVQAVLVLAPTAAGVVLAIAAVVELRVRVARRVVAAGGDRPPTQDPQWWMLGLAPASGVQRVRLLVVVTVGACLLYAYSAHWLRTDNEVIQDCGSVALPQQIRDRWIQDGAKLAHGCPTAAPTPTRDGLGRYATFADGAAIVTTPDGGVHVVPAGIAATWSRWGRESGALGYPQTDRRYDGDLVYVQFGGGYVVGDPDTGYRTVLDARYVPVARTPGRCPDTDRPCIVEVRTGPDSITVRWHYRRADAFNIGWSSGPVYTRTETDGYEYILRGVPPGRLYTFHVQACTKHFLSRSTCTGFSPAVTAAAGDVPQ